MRVTRAGTTLTMDMTCAKIVRNHSTDKVEVQLCFANALAHNCVPDVASTIVKKLQESIDTELYGLEWGGESEVVKLKGFLRKKIEGGVQNALK